MEELEEKGVEPLLFAVSFLSAKVGVPATSPLKGLAVDSTARSDSGRGYIRPRRRDSVKYEARESRERYRACRNATKIYQVC